MFPDSPYEHYLYPLSTTKIVCDVCAKEIFSDLNVTKCVVCGKILCRDCEIHGFCRDDYAKLSLQEKGEISHIEHVFGQKMKQFIAGLFVTTVFLLASFLIMIFGDQSPLIFNIGLFLAGSFFICLIGLLLYYMRFDNLQELIRKMIQH